MGSQQSELLSGADAAQDHRTALSRFLAAASGAAKVEVSGLAPLRGGALQENWAVDARFAGGPLAGYQRLVLRTAAPTGVATSLGRNEEFAVLKAAFAAGVIVPEPLFTSADPAIFGKAFFIMRRVDGTAAAHRITRDPLLDPSLPAIAERLGGELARIHTIRPPRSDLAFLPSYEQAGPAQQIARFRAYLDRHPVPRPVLEWGIRWLETHLPPPVEPVLCHHDYRTGNYMLDSANLTGILDWEFAGWGDPHEDIGWFCCKGWRFARLDREAGGIADRAPFYRGYEHQSGRRIDRERVFFWEVLASVRWAIIALQQSDRYLIGGERNLDLALTGRRATECELEILMLLDPDGTPAGA
jgi:aminoglycoside phosphotransferase (APT) family kinase protein